MLDSRQMLAIIENQIGDYGQAPVASSLQREMLLKYSNQPQTLRNVKDFRKYWNLRGSKEVQSVRTIDDDVKSLNRFETLDQIQQTLSTNIPNKNKIPSSMGTENIFENLGTDQSKNPNNLSGTINENPKSLQD